MTGKPRLLDAAKVAISSFRLALHFMDAPVERAAFTGILILEESDWWDTTYLYQIFNRVAYFSRLLQPAWGPENSGAAVSLNAIASFRGDRLDRGSRKLCTASHWLQIAPRPRDDE